MDADRELTSRWRESRALMDAAGAKIGELEQFIAKARDEVQHTLQLEAERAMFSAFDPALIQDFFKEPYVTIPRRPQEWYVIAPRFVNFQIGWLEKSTAAYNVFLVNKFMHWLAQIPEGLRRQFDFKAALPATVAEGLVHTDAEHQEEILARYRPLIDRRVGPDKLRIRSGMEFRLIAAMINDGTLPFRPHPVTREDRREPRWTEPVELREYQTDTWRRFLETGAVGVFWPFSAGKTYFGLYAIAHVKPPHLVVVPTATLREQWEERLRKHLGWSHGVQIVTYVAYEKVRQSTWRLVIFDECHRLPANTFARLSTLRTTYRIGLSGTPYREDGRTDFIFALTGFPVGIDWHRLLELGVFKKPRITLYLVADTKAKLAKAAELIRDPVKTIIFCDSIDLGRRIAEAHGLPHVHGETRDRLDKLRKAPQAVVSRVGDEGVSLPDIRRVIEVDFLYGSRRQEAQRLGRLFHGTQPGEHIILMTERELQDHEKRLYAIYDKGWNINIVR